VGRVQLISDAKLIGIVVVAALAVAGAVVLSAPTQVADVRTADQQRMNLEYELPRWPNNASICDYLTVEEKSKYNCAR
jgi:hypothetical protein